MGENEWKKLTLRLMQNATVSLHTLGGLGRLRFNLQHFVIPPWEAYCSSSIWSCMFFDSKIPLTAYCFDVMAYPPPPFPRSCICLGAEEIGYVRQLLEWNWKLRDWSFSSLGCPEVLFCFFSGVLCRPEEPS